MELLTVGGSGTVGVPDGENPIINPVGPLPTAGNLSVGTAAANAAAGASAPKQFLGIINVSDPGFKDILFMAGIGFLIYKYGRRYFK